MPSQLELAIEALRTISEFTSSDDPAVDQLAALLYTPDSKLGSFIVRIENMQSTAARLKGKDALKVKQDTGYLMESIAVLSFQSLVGWSELKSYQSAGPQHDLLIDGSSLEWQSLWRYFGIEPSVRQALVVETKAIGSRLADSEFARLCAVMDHNLSHAGLGIFFTLKGASGFPRPGKTVKGLRDCRMRQVIYFAKTSKPVIVFDEHDIKQLSSSGALPILIRRKIKEISELTGLSTVPVPQFKEIVLPEYLKKLLKLSSHP